MKVVLGEQHERVLKGRVRLTGSKSESNRLLILQAFYSNLELTNLSNADDVRFMQRALSSPDALEVDIHHAGTAMRFLTAFLATQNGRELVLTGSHRMKERPIGILVEALRSMGAQIDYDGEEGFPPLKITGKALTQKQVRIPAKVSSQYISALLLIAPSLPEGLEIELIGEITSRPYLEMTLSLLERIGVETHFEGQRIRVEPQADIAVQSQAVESDWSAASYYYSLIALSPVGSQMHLSVLREDSLQGDRVLAELYEAFGVVTRYEDQGVLLSKEREANSVFEADLKDAPDIAQTLAVSCLGLGMRCDMTGLHTLPIKETDRLAAMKTELEKFGAEVEITDRSLHLKAFEGDLSSVPQVDIETYHDHRMAMAFAPLCQKAKMRILEAAVVSKSYPEFWKDWAALGLWVEEE
jgi:3-phosphoshikimate 1-carboxyvinyltransferase